MFEPFTESNGKSMPADELISPPKRRCSEDAALEVKRPKTGDTEIKSTAVASGNGTSNHHESPKLTKDDNGSGENESKTLTLVAPATSSTGDESTNAQQSLPDENKGDGTIIVQPADVDGSAAAKTSCKLSGDSVAGATVKSTVDENEPSSALEESTIDLDSTLDTTISDIAKENHSETHFADDDQSVNNKTNNDFVCESVAPEKRPEGEVTITDSSLSGVANGYDDDTLATPNISLAEKPVPALSHNRISELVFNGGSSTPNTSNPTSVEAGFQATPIKKAEELPTTEESSSQEISSLEDKIIDERIRQLQALNAPTTTDSSAPSDAETSKVNTGYSLYSSTDCAAMPESQLYDTAVNFLNGTLQCLFVERVIKPVTIPSDFSDAASEKSGSNGSTTSLGPFVLPGAVTHTNSGLSVSSTSSTGSRPLFLPTSHAPVDRNRVKGTAGLRAFLQGLLNQLPQPEQKRAGRPAKSRTAVDAKREGDQSRQVQSNDTSLKQSAPVSSTPEGRVGYFVMARWTDKKYYAGRISAEKPGNKYLVRFEDGANKTLSRDQLVFGDACVVPLLNFECNVLVEPSVYETGLVVAIDSVNCTYNVLTDSGTVTVPLSDIYLDEEQAKPVQQTQNVSPGSAGAMEDPTTLTGRRKRTSDALSLSPKAGPSNVEMASKKIKKRSIPPPQLQSSDTQMSDLSDTEPAKTEIVCEFVEAVDGVQPEKSKCPIQTKINLTCGYFKDGLDQNQLGDLPSNNLLFNGKCVLLTETDTLNPSQGAGPFSDCPFVMEHLLKQLQCGGATVYGHFEEIPKIKHKSCLLVAKQPCLTARYIQCLAVNMTVVSHSWVIESCRHNKLQDVKSFALPAGWSVLENDYVRYVTGRSEKRPHARPFLNLNLLISSENEEFVKFWTGVCVGAKVKHVNSPLDIVCPSTKKTYMLTDSEVLVPNVEKAKALSIQIVSTAWVAECLIQGKLVRPEDHANFTKANWDLQL